MSLVQKVAFLFLPLAMSAASAQEAASGSVDDAPPKIIITDDTGKELSIEDLEPEVTITPKDDETVTEYKVRGRVYLIKVQPKVGAPYYLADPEGDGQFNRIGGGIDETIQAPMWLIKSW